MASLVCAEHCVIPVQNAPFRLQPGALVHSRVSKTSQFTWSPSMGTQDCTEQPGSWQPFVTNPGHAASPAQCGATGGAKPHPRTCPQVVKSHLAGAEPAQACPLHKQWWSATHSDSVRSSHAMGVPMQL